MRLQAALDPPAETKRQFFTLVIWVFFLASAIVAATALGTHLPGMVDPVTMDPQSGAAQAELHRSRMARVKVALLIGLAAPAFCSLWLRRRYRRHGEYARGITVELTDTELRVWGRGYGTRVTVVGAKVDERLVDVYAGRLGAWRQVRLRVRAKTREIELAAQAEQHDLTRGLRLDGGEGDCVEVDRDDYEALKVEIARRQGASEGEDRLATSGVTTKHAPEQ